MVVGISLATSSKAEIVIISEPVKFGWFKKLNEDQMAMYNSSMVQALLYAETGDPVRWRTTGAKGSSVVLLTAPNGDGYCRTLYQEVFAFGKRKTGTHKYCYSNSLGTWSLRQY